MWSVECKVRSVECKVWSVECRVWECGSVECKVWSVECKRHDNLLGNLRKERFCSFPHRHGDATGKPETRDETRGRSKNEHFVQDILQF